MYNRYIKNKDYCIIYKLYEIGAKKREGGKKAVDEIYDNTYISSLYHLIIIY